MDIFYAIVWWVLGAMITVIVLYWTIRQAVLHALREHTLSSTTAVMVTKSVPVEVKSLPETGTHAAAE
ncbi:hypothetical protein [Microbacterium terricola]|uniref:Uncharacterized protein n=1 Tax=Microbacterium terricola TaxID=344163 RepID=A0ABM8E279_9MICO|nr:hypothetical protein [Microbacterium terricola]UYK40412.1 hypothetical protein OAU46_01800 [Microbacterium terricola]BDV31870.1 hypothetical protein Microterr_25300 [Microbacterium terricola]